MSECASYETPLWTLIGVLFGFVLSYLYNIILQKKQYKVRSREVIERIKKIIHIPDVQQAKRRLADSLPQFREKEQFEILAEVGIESCLNEYSAEVAHYVLDEYNWMITLYDLMVNNNYNLIAASKQDKVRVLAIQSALSEMAFNIVDLRRAKKLLKHTLTLLEILDKYAIYQRYDKVIISAIRIYESIGRWSVGEKDKYSHYRVGIEMSINHLERLKQYILGSTLAGKKRSELTSMIDLASSTVKNCCLKNKL